MPRPLPPPNDAQLMMLSAFLDGELTPAEETQIFDAMSQNPQLLDAFEAMTAAHVGRMNALVEPSAEEADALVASIMAATSPAEIPASVDGALQFAQLALDGVDVDHAAQAALAAALSKPGAAPAVSGFVASAEATQAALRAVSAVPSVVESLRAIPDHVGARVAAAERFGILASACLDDALTPSESSELDGLLARGAVFFDPDEVPALMGALHAAEALRVASTSTAFARLGAKAGEAALHVIEAERVQAVQTQPARPVRTVEPAPSLFARLGALFAATRAPLAFAGAAFALFFVVGRSAETVTTPSDDDVRRDILAAWERVVDDDDSRGTDIARAYGDLPLLADNSADVEAIDSAGTTVVFATESSNITVIWVDVEAEEGT